MANAENIHDRSCCRACREPIHSQARICPHCQSRQALRWYHSLGTFMKWGAGSVTIVSLLIGVVTLLDFYRNWLEKEETVSELIDAGRLLHESGEYERAWEIYLEVLELEPGSLETRGEQIRLAQEMVRGFDQEWGPETEEIKTWLEQLHPVLYRGAATLNGKDAATSLAHIAYAYYILDKRMSEKASLETTDQLFEKALLLDPENVYANAMKGCWLLFRGGDLDEADQCFARALAARREQPWVRHVQLRSLTGPIYRFIPHMDIFEKEERLIRMRKEAVDVVNRMRKNGEPLPPLATSERVLSCCYHDYRENKLDRVEAMLSLLPEKEHIDTINWLLHPLVKHHGPDENFSHSKAFVLYALARLQETSGNRAEALKLYQELDKEDSYYSAHLIQAVDEGMARLVEKPPR